MTGSWTDTDHKRARQLYELEQVGPHGETRRSLRRIELEALDDLYAQTRKAIDHGEIAALDGARLLLDIGRERRLVAGLGVPF
jgi:hypothetical protein